MPFDTKMTERLNAIKKACGTYDMDAFVVNEFRTKNNQTIDSNIIAAIKSSRFVIADFTSLNLGVYFEAGYAMGRDMKVIHVCDDADFSLNKKHFDISHYPFLRYSSFEDLTKQLAVEIAAYINI
jgi:nucleoside 2-deoxyribosyltransferase